MVWKTDSVHGCPDASVYRHIPEISYYLARINHPLLDFCSTGLIVKLYKFIQYPWFKSRTYFMIFTRLLLCLPVDCEHYWCRGHYLRGSISFRSRHIHDRHVCDSHIWWWVNYLWSLLKEIFQVALALLTCDETRVRWQLQENHARSPALQENHAGSPALQPDKWRNAVADHCSKPR